MQGSGADVPKLALAPLWEYRQKATEAVPVLCVHDEIVVECPVEAAASAAKSLREHMEAAEITLVPHVPVEVDVTVAGDWAGESRE